MSNIWSNVVHLRSLRENVMVFISNEKKFTFLVVVGFLIFIKITKPNTWSFSQIYYVLKNY